MLNSSKTKIKRPLSPHLQVYRPQITSVLSIVHRLTGVVLFFGLWLLATWIFLNVYSCAACINPLIESIYGRIFLVLWTLALYYHFLNGIRHLFWDIGKGYDLDVLKKSGYFVLFGTVVLTFITWLIGYII